MSKALRFRGSHLIFGRASCVLTRNNPLTPNFSFIAFSPTSWRCSGSITSRSQLRNTVQVAPIPVVLEGTPQSTDVHTKIPAVYGTRLSTVLLIKRNGDVYFVERDIWARSADGTGSVVSVDPPTQREYRFTLDLEAIRQSEGSSTSPVGSTSPQEA